MDTPTDVAVEIIGRSRATPTLSLLVHHWR